MENMENTNVISIQECRDNAMLEVSARLLPFTESDFSAIICDLMVNKQAFKSVVWC